jgi:hypothetical protein
MQYAIRPCGDGWIISAHGVDQPYCDRAQMAVRVVKEATLLLEQEQRRTEEALSLRFERREW